MNVVVDNLLSLVRRANERNSIITTIDDIQMLNLNESAECWRVIQNEFLAKLQPNLFAQITENEFKELYGRIFLKSTFPAHSLLNLIQFIGSIQKNEIFKFNKLLDLILNFQVELLHCSFKNKDELNKSRIPREHFSFVIASFSDRLYNFVGHANQNCASIIVLFEKNLLNSFNQIFDDRSSNLNVDIELMANILSDYNSISKEFINNFLLASQKGEYAKILKSIFTFSNISRRKRENLIITLINYANDGKMLQHFFGETLQSDNLLRKCLLGRAIYISPISYSMRNSKKIAEYFSIFESELSKAFMELVQLYSDQCRIIDLITLHDQFQISVAIYDFSHRISKENRLKIRDEMTNILVPIFPQLFQIADISRRQIAMFLAENIFSIFECPSPPKFDYIFGEGNLLFQEFVSIVKEEEENKSTKDTKIFDGKDNKNGTLKKRPQRRVNPRVEILDSDDDEEDENEPIIDGKYELNLNGQIDLELEENEMHRFSYLRDCIEFLRSEKEDWKKWEAALKIIPLKFIKEETLGLEVLVIELLELILFLEDRFNIKHFTAIKTQILKHILAFKPDLVSHLARLFQSKTCSISQKYLILSAIVLAAKFMSENGNEEERKNSINKKICSPTKKEPKLVWRSEKLGNELNEGLVKKNKFFSIAQQFAFPLLELCTSTQFLERDFLLFGKTIWALAEIIQCSKNSPSILRICSATFSWIQLILFTHHKIVENTFVLANIMNCYLAILNTLNIQIIKEHFTEELQKLLEWLDRNNAKMEGNEALYLLSSKLNEIFTS